MKRVSIVLVTALCAVLLLLTVGCVEPRAEDETATEYVAELAILGKEGRALLRVSAPAPGDNWSWWLPEGVQPAQEQWQVSMPSGWVDGWFEVPLDSTPGAHSFENFQLVLLDFLPLIEVGKARVPGKVKLAVRIDETYVVAASGACGDVVYLDGEQTAHFSIKDCRHVAVVASCRYIMKGEGAVQYLYEEDLHAGMSLTCAEKALSWAAERTGCKAQKLVFATTHLAYPIFYPGLVLLPVDEGLENRLQSIVEGVMAQGLGRHRLGKGEADSWLSDSMSAFAAWLYWEEEDADMATRRYNRAYAEAFTYGALHGHSGEGARMDTVGLSPYEERILYWEKGLVMWHSLYRLVGAPLGAKTWKLMGDGEVLSVARVLEGLSHDYGYFVDAWVKGRVWLT